MFLSRSDAGGKLAQKIIQQKISADLVLGITRGGVVVAEVIAQKLHLPLDIIVVKKLGAPDNPELAIGAVAPDKVRFIDQRFADLVGADNLYLEQEIKKKQEELVSLEKRLRGTRKKRLVTGKQVILTDDGVATGATVFAAIAWLKKQHSSKIILALPVAASQIVEKLHQEVDRCIILETPADFQAVGQFYQEFGQVNEEEILKLLN